MGVKMSYAHQVEVFSIKPLTVKADGFDISTCYLDEIEQFEQELSDLSQIKVLERVKDKENDLLKAMRCHYQASLYQIAKLPAIVIDGEYVVYGIDSVSSALSLFASRGEAHA